MLYEEAKTSLQSKLQSDEEQSEANKSLRMIEENTITNNSNISNMNNDVVNNEESLHVLNIPSAPPYDSSLIDSPITSPISNDGSMGPPPPSYDDIDMIPQDDEINNLNFDNDHYENNNENNHGHNVHNENESRKRSSTCATDDMNEFDDPDNLFHDTLEHHEHEDIGINDDNDDDENVLKIKDIEIEKLIINITSLKDQIITLEETNQILILENEKKLNDYNQIELEIKNLELKYKHDFDNLNQEMDLENMKFCEERSGLSEKCEKAEAAMEQLTQRVRVSKFL